MRAWLIYDEQGAERNKDYIRMHEQIGKQFDIDFELCIKERDIWCEHELPDFAIVRTIDPLLTKRIEHLGVPVFNNGMVSEICNHKGKTIQYVKENTKVPVIDTVILNGEKLTPYFLQSHSGCVVKSVDGHGGSEVFRTDDDPERIYSILNRKECVLQPFVGQGSDIRVYVIGRQIIGAVQRISRDGFHSNFSLGGSVSLIKPDKTLTNYVEQICNVFSFGMVGIDFIIDREQYILNEIEDVVGARMLYQCDPEIQLLERYFTFIQEKLLQCN